MIIEKIRAPQNNTFHEPQQEPSFRSDVDFFSSMISPSSPAPLAAAPALSKSLLTDAADTLNTMTNRMSRSLRALAGKNKSDEARKYPEQLSNAVLLQHMLTKCVGKTAQGIDKISNLQ